MKKLAETLRHIADMIDRSEFDSHEGELRVNVEYSTQTVEEGGMTLMRPGSRYATVQIVGDIVFKGTAK